MTLDGQSVAVHRVMWVLLFGYIPGREQVDHTCRNRLCVNPMHLEKVTHKENQRRRDRARADMMGHNNGPTLEPLMCERIEE